MDRFINKYTIRIAGVLCIILLWFLLNLNYAVSHEKELKNATLENVVLRTEESDDSKTGKVYYLYTFETEDGEIVTCKNQDSLYLLKYNSGDYEAILKKGNRYNIEYRGARWHFFSTYPNLLKAEKTQ